VAAIVQIVQIEEIEAPVPKVLTLAVLVRRLEIEALGPNDRQATGRRGRGLSSVRGRPCLLVVIRCPVAPPMVTETVTINGQRAILQSLDRSRSVLCGWTSPSNAVLGDKIRNQQRPKLKAKLHLGKSLSWMRTSTVPLSPELSPVIVDVRAKVPPWIRLLASRDSAPVAGPKSAICKVAEAVLSITSSVSARSLSHPL
jgi:hypothetical protein